MLKIITRKDFEALQADKATILQKCEGLENTVKTLQDMSKDMTEAQAEHNKVIADINTAHQATVDTMKADFEKAMADSKVAYEKQISDLKLSVSVEQTASEDKAIQVLAQIGIPADETPKVAKQDKTQILEQARNLNGEGLDEFIKSNKRAIYEALKIAKKK